MLRFETVGATLPPGFPALLADAQAEGFTHLDRLAADWNSGALRFGDAGERLVAVYQDQILVGIGGLTREPTMPDRAMRMRRFYVRSTLRRQGIASRLVRHLLDHARHCGAVCVTVHAARQEAGDFWVACGFQPDERDGFSHLLSF